jgi:hypothetical protein
MSKSNVIDETVEVIAARRLATAKREHDQLVAEWRELDTLEAGLDGRKTDRQGRRVVVVNDVTRTFEDLDRVEHTALRSRLNADRQELAERLITARHVLKQAYLDSLRAQLPAVVTAWKQRVETMLESRALVEHDLAALVTSLAAYSAASAAERQAARRVNSTAAEGFIDDTSKDAIRSLDLLRQVVGDVEHDGALIPVDRPEPGLFGDDDPPDGEQIGRLLALAYTSPERLESQLRGTQLGRAAGINPKTTR